MIEEITLLDGALALARVGVGTFFTISGYHKLFCPKRHAALVETLEADGIPFPRLTAWPVAVTELVGGSALAIGLAVPLAATALIAICVVACLVDGLARVREMHPINRADFIDDLLYLPETIYVVVLAVIFSAWPDPLSLDFWLIVAM